MFNLIHHIRIIHVQLCEKGDLWNIIEQYGSTYSESDAAQLMRQIIIVVAHCHSMGIIHRDVKVCGCWWVCFFLVIP